MCRRVLFVVVGVNCVVCVMLLLLFVVGVVVACCFLLLLSFDVFLGVFLGGVLFIVGVV